MLKPLATAEFLVVQKEIEGGSGANYIVERVSAEKVNQPAIEAAECRLRRLSPGSACLSL